MTKTNGHAERCLRCSGTGRLFSLSMSSTDDVDCDACGGSGKDARVEPPRERCTILPLDDPRPALTLADGTTVRADAVFEWNTDDPPVPYPRMAHGDGCTFYEGRTSGWELGRAGVDYSADDWRRVYPPPDRPTREETARLAGLLDQGPSLGDDDRTAIIRDELADQARRTMLRESIARLRPGDEIEITHAGRRTWARLTRITRTDPAWPSTPAIRERVERIAERSNARPLYVEGRTTFGLIVTSHEAHISDVRVEPNEAVRASWVGRHA